MITVSGAKFVELTIDAESTRNALGLDELEQLCGALETVGSSEARVVIVRGAGQIFSSGANMRELEAPGVLERSSERLGMILDLVDRLNQPVIAAVNGDAYGGGLALLAACDLVIAVEQARFAMPETRYGMVGTVAAASICNRITTAAALDLLLTGRRIAAPEAHAIGLVSAVVAADGLDEAVRAASNAMALGTPAAVAATKRVIRGLGRQSLAERLQLAATLSERAPE